MSSPSPEDRLTAAVLARMDAAPDRRFAEVMTSLIRHLHDFVRETELTQTEWAAAIGFLTATGRKCDDRRQEFILLSDTLGVSMLVDAINHRRPDGATETTVLGPFYVPGSDILPMWGDIAPGVPGETTFVSGHVRDVSGRPIQGALLDIWQTDGEGLYDVQRPDGHYARGKTRTDGQGRFGFRTVKPVSYAVPTDGPVGEMLRRMGRHAYRPAHVHTIVSAPGCESITTHLFVRGDPYLGSDAVFGVKDSLVVEFSRHESGTAPDGGHRDAPFYTAQYDYVLVRE